MRKEPIKLLKEFKADAEEWIQENNILQVFFLPPPSPAPLLFFLFLLFQKKNVDPGGFDFSKKKIKKKKELSSKDRESSKLRIQTMIQDLHQTNNSKVAFFCHFSSLLSTLFFVFVVRIFPHTHTHTPFTKEQKRKHKSTLF